MEAVSAGAFALVPCALCVCFVEDVVCVFVEDVMYVCVSACVGQTQSPGLTAFVSGREEEGWGATTSIGASVLHFELALYFIVWMDAVVLAGFVVCCRMHDRAAAVVVVVVVVAGCR